MERPIRVRPNGTLPEHVCGTTACDPGKGVWENPGTPPRRAVLAAFRRMMCVLGLPRPYSTAHIKR